MKSVLDKCTGCFNLKWLNAKRKKRFLCRIESKNFLTMEACPEYSKSAQNAFIKEKDNNLTVIKPYTNAELEGQKIKRLKWRIKNKRGKKKMSDEQQETLEKVDVETGEIELPKIDISKYIGKRVKIVSADTMRSKKFGGGYVVQVQTEIVETIAGGKKPIELRGSRIFGLHEDKEGNLGWADTTKLGQFLRKMKAKKLSDLIGKEVILQSTANKDGIEYLGF